MKNYFKILVLIIICNYTFAEISAISKKSQDRIISIGGSVTEILFELGLGDLVVAVDQSSTFPKEVKDLPQVGYIRAISSEGVLSMNPTKIITTTDIGPPNAIKQIKDSGINTQIFDSPKNIEDIVALIIEVSNLFEAKDKASIAIKEIYKIKDSIKNLASGYAYKPKVAFFMSPSNGSYTAAGSGTNANYLIELIGGNNIFSNDFKRYQKVNKEEILKYDPDIILVASHYPGEKSSSHFTEEPIFKSLSCIKKKNVINISMSDLTMGPSFVSNALSIAKRVNIDK
tara:strand:- start:227 stop:1084 length:858 start_codon:yes stop_codon:yes gene_type:complete